MARDARCVNCHARVSVLSSCQTFTLEAVLALDFPGDRPMARQQDAMQIAISTAALGLATPLAVQRAAELGFTTLEVNLLPHEFDYGLRRRPDVRFYRDLKALLTQLGLSVWSVAMPPLNQAQMFSVRARKEILLNAAGAAGILGASVFVVEPPHIFQDEERLEDYWRTRNAPPVLAGFDESWAQVVNRRMSYALLNSEYWLGAPLTNQSDRIAHLTFDLGIGWAMDLRAALHRNNLETWLAAVGERLAIAYVYDVTDQDTAPQAPLSDDWAVWLPTLAATRLKALALRGQPHTDDATWRASLAHIRRCLTLVAL